MRTKGCERPLTLRQFPKEAGDPEPQPQAEGLLGDEVKGKPRQVSLGQKPRLGGSREGGAWQGLDRACGLQPFPDHLLLCSS